MLHLVSYLRHEPELPWDGTSSAGALGTEWASPRRRAQPQALSLPGHRQPRYVGEPGDCSPGAQPKVAAMGCGGHGGSWGGQGRPCPGTLKANTKGSGPQRWQQGICPLTYCPFCQTLLGTQQWGSGTVMSSQASASVPKEGYKPSTVMLRRCTGGKCASRTQKSFSHHEQKIKEKKSFVGEFTTPKIFLLLLRRQSCSTAAFFL